MVRFTINSKWNITTYWISKQLAHTRKFVECQKYMFIQSRLCIIHIYQQEEKFMCPLVASRVLSLISFATGICYAALFFLERWYGIVYWQNTAECCRRYIRVSICYLLVSDTRRYLVSLILLVCAWIIILKPSNNHSSHIMCILQSRYDFTFIDVWLHSSWSLLTIL